MATIQEHYKTLVVEALMEKEDIPWEWAEKKVNDSSVADLLKTDPEFIGHYPVEHWLETIISENQ